MHASQTSFRWDHLGGITLTTILFAAAEFLLHTWSYSLQFVSQSVFYIAISTCYTFTGAGLSHIRQTLRAMPSGVFRGGPCARPPPPWPDRRDFCNYFRIIFSAV